MAANLFNKTILAACGSDSLTRALQSSATAVIYMNADINELVTKSFRERCRQKPILIHFDLLKGLSGDKEALRFLKRVIDPYGVVTTKSNIIRAAKSEGLFTLQRIFLIDTKSFRNSLDAVSENKPDAIEIMPAIAPTIVPRYKNHTNIPVVLGGLISDKSQINEAFRCGADAVSMTNSELWNYKYNL